MSLNLVIDNMPKPQVQNAQWEILRALSLHVEANPELAKDSHYQSEIKRAHFAWQNSFVGVR